MSLLDWTTRRWGLAPWRDRVLGWGLALPPMSWDVICILLAFCLIDMILNSFICLVLCYYIFRFKFHFLLASCIGVGCWGLIFLFCPGATACWVVAWCFLCILLVFWLIDQILTGFICLVLCYYIFRLKFHFLLASCIGVGCWGLIFLFCP